jgi:predicted deacylase
MLRLDAPPLDGLELPIFEARGDAAGPRVCLLAGVHGCEYSSIAALTRFMRGLDTAALRGSVVAAPIVGMPSFRARSPFVTPQDGKNLNRCFPGDPDGTFSDVLAHHVFEQLIRPSDALIDLHGGDMVEALEPFTLYDESPVDGRARDMALAFGLPYVICTPAGDTIGGTTSQAAATAGIPAITPECGGIGQLDERAVEAHVAGLENTLRALGSLPGYAAPPPAGAKLVTEFTWLRAPIAGWWGCDVSAGEKVAAGQRLGALCDLHGDELHTVVSPADGVVLFVTTSPAMAEDGILLAVGAGIQPL